MKNFLVIAKIEDMKQFILLARLYKWHSNSIDSDLKHYELTRKENFKVAIKFLPQVENGTIPDRFFHITMSIETMEDPVYELPREKDKIFELIKAKY